MLLSLIYQKRKAVLCKTIYLIKFFKNLFMQPENIKLSDDQETVTFTLDGIEHLLNIPCFLPWEVRTATSPVA